MTRENQSGRLFAPAVILLAAAVFWLSACGGRETVTAGWAHAGRCQQHDECPGGASCVEARCVSGAGAQPATVSREAAARYFTSDSCTRDAQCGPWMCSENSCVPAEELVELPGRDAFRYWDLSCRNDDDCGDWVCANSWCAEPGRLASQPCVSDDECLLEGSACVYPGVCADDAAGRPFDFAALEGSVVLGEDGYCGSDSECGPWLCEYNVCTPPTGVLNSVPNNREIRFADASCHSDDDCGNWICSGGYCRDPQRVTETAGALLLSVFNDAPSGTAVGAGGSLFGIGTGGGIGGLGLSGSGAGGLLQSTQPTCSEQSQCNAGSACVPPGVCVVGADVLPMDVSSLNASQWYTNGDGSCADDADCGPWVCHNQTCAEPASVGFIMLQARQYRYYDTSCTSDPECGAWVCSRGWCTRP